MNEYKIVYSPAALDDLEAVYEYIAFTLTAPSTAKKQVDRIRSRIGSLNSMPERFVRVEWEPWFSMSIRKTVVDRYLIFYLVKPEDNSVVILRIIYGGRNIEDELKK